jgi:hypothetical protein
MSHLLREPVRLEPQEGRDFELIEGKARELCVCGGGVKVNGQQGGVKR